MTATADALMAIFGFKRVEGMQMKTDRELLELAAKAVGHAIDPIDAMHEPEDLACWNPLTDDGDALRLAVLLRMEIDHNYPVAERVLGVSVRASGMRSCEILEDHNGEPLAATRRAIVRAAAAIGEAMQ